MTLTTEQTAAIESLAPRLAIRAGAGTGKTRVLVERALRLACRHDLVRLLTFSRRAARVLRARLEAIASPLTDRIEVDTHHGLAHGLLRRWGSLVGLPDEWQVIDRIEERAAEKQAGQQMDLFERALQRHHLVRYDQLLPMALRLLDDSYTVRAEECAGAALLVDEGQDSSILQHELDEALQPESLTIVGDEAQRIYGFAGAAPMPSGPEWTTLPLARNYRSGREILSLANRLPIPGRVDLVPARSNAGLVDQVTCLDDLDAVRWLVDRTDLGDRPEGWAILTRTNRRLDPIADYLADRGIPVCPWRTEQTWDTPQARRLVDLLHVVANPHDSYHLVRALQEHEGWTQLQVLEAEAGRATSTQSLWDWVVTSEKIRQVRVPQTDLIPRLSRIAPTDPAWDVARTLSYLTGHLPLEVIPHDLTVEELLVWLADPDREEPEAGEAPTGVYLGSLHSAKGAEWPSVCLLGLEEGSLPIARWSAERREERERIAEERRLLYVGITRARDRLVLARTQMGRRGKELDPSRFLAEMGLR